MLILIAAAGLRFYKLPQLGFWTDELFSLSDANGWGLQPAFLHGTGLLPPGQIHYTRRSDARGVRAMLDELSRSEIHPPLYFLMLRGWEGLFGADDEVTVRSLSVLLSLAAITLLYFAVREQHSASIALWACALMAVAGPQIEYAQEARDYMPLLTFSLAAAVPLLRIERLGATPARLIALAIALLALMLSNYFAVALIAAMAIYMLLQFPGADRWRTLAAFIAAAAVFAILWGPSLLRQLPRFVEGHAWLIVSGGDRGARESTAFITLPARLLFEIGLHSKFRSVAPWLWILWLLVPIGLLRRSTRLWALWFFLPVAMITGSDLRESMTQLSMVRFTLGASPGLYVLIAAAVEPLSPTSASGLRGISMLPAAGCALLASLALPLAYTPPWKLDFRPAALILASRLNPQTDGLVFVGPPGDELWTAVSLSGFRHYLPREPTVLAVLQKRADEPLVRRLQQCRRVWVISRPLYQPLQGFIPGYRIEEQGEIPDFVAVLRGRVSRMPGTDAVGPGP